MTQAQYYKIAEDFATYANAKVYYIARYPDNREVKTWGWLQGIGMGANAGNFIIANMGRRCIAHWEDVKFPTRIEKY